MKRAHERLESEFSDAVHASALCRALKRGCAHLPKRCCAHLLNRGCAHCASTWCRLGLPERATCKPRRGAEGDAVYQGLLPQRRTLVDVMDTLPSPACVEPLTGVAVKVNDAPSTVTAKV
jgi:hypothetical protein